MKKVFFVSKVNTLPIDDHVSLVTCLLFYQHTRRLEFDGVVENLMVLYKRFQELGGRYVTLGSDAHYSEHVGRGLESALEIAHQCNLQPVYFKERKRMVMKEGE